MAPRTVRLLHVEDSRTQQRYLAHQLGKLEDLTFEITTVESEDAAVARFDERTEFVVLDYQLSAGNGLSCLRRLRQRDAIVPIVAVSGVASSEIAAELLKGGADDFISKPDLNRDRLAAAVRGALARADALRQRNVATKPGAGPELEALLRRLGQSFLDRLGPAFLLGLDEFEAAARQAKLTVGQLNHGFGTVCTELASGQTGAGLPVRRFLRPLLLDIILRLYGDVADAPVQVQGPTDRPR